MKRLIPLFSVFLIACNAYAQEPFFSQFYNAPLSVNPAFTGTAYGYIRTTLNYKDYFNDFEKIRTVALAADLSLLENDRNPDYAGVGIYFQNDQAGQALTNTKVMASFSYHNAYGRDRNEFLAFGMQAGIDNTNLDFAGLTTQSQWVIGQGFDMDLPNGEIIQGERATVINFNAGLMWYKFLRNGTSFIVGVSSFHLAQPKRDFVGEENKLFRKYVAHGSSRIPVNQRMNFAPSLLYFYQNGNHTISPGAAIEFVLQKDSYFSFGGWVRNFNAIIGTVQLEYNNFTVGASYDLLLSSISDASRNGGLEISLNYLVKRTYKKRARIRSNTRPRL
ncbi:type IX secretion system membrane protein PorP/SprF [Fulvivirga sp. M361]|uniref:PorP/SprF family type IX secretion system membrane protein n=1 Tax=Fulvivirga sp. M361 TaxID=2594266 RepID=UPI00117BC730|nr:PorP/SprF family type IX secretion system membrane protein [Fulvivirga sp. M361]TRX52045.1 type IX secretion system membrane protein PorP/SprF [Fulvivirga sp. M361]